MEKITSKNTNRALRDTNADKTTVLLSHSKKQLFFYCRILLLALHIALICSTINLALIRCSDVTRGLSQGTRSWREPTG